MAKKPTPPADLDTARAKRTAHEDAEIRDAIRDITKQKKAQQAPPKRLDVPKRTPKG